VDNYVDSFPHLRKCSNLQVNRVLPGLWIDVYGVIFE